jgi:uncharacterized protein
MPITVPCPTCKAKLKAPEGLLGKTVKCPGCKTPVLIRATVGATAPAPAPARATPTPPAPQQAPVLDQLEEVDDVDEVEEVAEVAEVAEAEVDDVRPGRNGKDRREEITPAAARRGVREDRPRRDRRREEVDEVDEVGEVAEVEEDEDDRPRRKGKGRKSRGGPTSDSERTMAMLVYLLGLFVPFGGLILWLVKRNESRFIDWHGKQHVNVMITSMIAFMACLIPGLILGPIWTVFSIIAAVKAKNGEHYEIPMIFRFIK